MKTTSIEWCDSTWNTVTGCTHVSEGCRHCYAEAVTKRLVAMGNEKYRNGFGAVTLHPGSLNDPKRWTGARRIFVNSMADTFHPNVPFDFVNKILLVVAACAQHTFIVLTKRADRMQEYFDKAPYMGNRLSNLWVGVSVESAEHMGRINRLRATPLGTRVVSFEPLLGPMPENLDLAGVDWVIVGGESGPRARKMEEAWALHIRDVCQRDGVAFFFKQWGGTQKWRAGRMLRGFEHSEYPHEHPV